MPSNNVGFLKQFHENDRKNNTDDDEVEEDDIQGKMMLEMTRRRNQNGRQNINHSQSEPIKISHQK